MSNRFIAAAVALGTAALFVASAVPAAHAQSTAQLANQAQPMAAADRKMMQDLAEANLAEVETGKIAQKNAGGDAVKAYGQMMVTDHSQALQELQAMAAAKGVELPKAPNAKHVAAAKTLQSLNGDTFDKRYASMAVSDHEETLALLRKVLKESKDGDLRNFASETVPAVSAHLGEARKLAGGK